MYWQTTRYSLDLQRPHVMGIVNVTPDSFSDGGRYASPGAAQRHCEQLLKDGADILDIGGESSRPGATPLPLSDEMERVLPVLRHAVTLGVPVSIDTYKPQLMQVALDLGVDIINDIWALRWRDPSAAVPLAASDVVSQHPNCGVCLMHMHRDPQSMQTEPMQGDAVAQTLLFLESVTQSLRMQGVDATRICVDPGIGFGKTVDQNFTLLAQQERLLALGYPLMAGWSRKSSLAAVTETSLSQVANMEDRMVPSVTAAVLAVERGAQVVRVHDVKETVQALKVLAAMQRNKDVR